MKERQKKICVGLTPQTYVQKVTALYSNSAVMFQGILVTQFTSLLPYSVWALWRGEESLPHSNPFIFDSLQTESWAQPTSYLIGTVVSFVGCTATRGMKLTALFHLCLVKNGGILPPLPRTSLSLGT
jgi:hypothetical protein